MKFRCVFDCSMYRHDGELLFGAHQFFLMQYSKCVCTKIKCLYTYYLERKKLECIGQIDTYILFAGFLIWSTITYFYFDGCFYKTTKLSEIRVRKHMSRFYFSISIFNFNTGLWSHPSCISTYLFTIIKKINIFGKNLWTTFLMSSNYVLTYLFCMYIQKLPDQNS